MVGDCPQVFGVGTVPQPCDLGTVPKLIGPAGKDLRGCTKKVAKVFVKEYKIKFQKEF
jgi:hypothetical protein